MPQGRNVSQAISNKYDNDRPRQNVSGNISDSAKGRKNVGAGGGIVQSASNGIDIVGNDAQLDIGALPTAP